MTRDFVGAALVAIALVAIGIATHGGVPAVDQSYLTSYPSDSRIYLSMAAHRELTVFPPSPGDPPLPRSHVRPVFRYRILVPWLASLMPFGVVFSFALVTWTSLAGAYIFVILTCRRLGLSFSASAGAIAIAFTFVSHLPIYFGPWLTDGVILLVLSGMTYAFVTDNFWLFAGLGLAGVFAREVPAVLLPVWCVRGVKRGLTVTALAVTAMTVLRFALRDPADPDVLALTPSGLLTAAGQIVREGPPGASFWPGVHWPANHLRGLVIDIEASWGWAFPLVAMGVWLLPREALARVGPVMATLVIAACGMSLIATDVSREFMILLPVVVAAIAVVITALAAKRQFVWLGLLAVLAALQFCLSEPNVVLRQDAWAVWSARVPLIKIGVGWAVGTAFVLRRDLARRVTSPGYTLPHRAR